MSNTITVRRRSKTVAAVLQARHDSARQFPKMRRSTGRRQLNAKQMGSPVNLAASWTGPPPLKSACPMQDKNPPRHDEQRAITKKSDNHDATNRSKHVVICTVLTVHKDEFTNAVG